MGHVGTGKSIGPPYYPLRYGLPVCMERRYVYIVFGLFPSLLMPHPFYVETKALETHLSLLSSGSFSKLPVLVNFPYITKAHKKTVQAHHKIHWKFKKSTIRFFANSRCMVMHNKQEKKLEMKMPIFNTFKML